MESRFSNRDWLPQEGESRLESRDSGLYGDLRFGCAQRPAFGPEGPSGPEREFTEGKLTTPVSIWPPGSLPAYLAGRRS